MSSTSPQFQAKKLLLAMLCAGSALLSVPVYAAPLQIAAPKAVQINIEPKAGLLQQETEVRAAPGASFVKLHFEYFNLPAGAVLEVSDASGKEVYRYASGKLGPHTIERKLGENGKTSFGAMSVNGEVAKVRLLLNGAQWKWAEHGARIRQVMEGFSREKVNEAIRLSSQGPVNTLSVCGVDERRDAVCFENSHPQEYERSQPVARLVMGGGLCTAWRLGDANHMMTNNHCIATQSETQASEVWFNYQNTTCGSSSLGTVTKVTAANLLKTDESLDYSLFTINDLARVANFGNLGLEVRTPVKEEQIFIPQHGGGNPKQLGIFSDVNTGGLCRIDTPIQNGSGTNTDTGYRCDTIGGSSGSPVLASSSRRVIALHHLGGCPSGNNSGALISLIWPQIAGFFNNQIPQGNAGTPLPPSTPLTPNVVLGNQAGALNAETLYHLDLAEVPNNLSFSTNGGSGNLNMYVKYGSLPTSTVADCKAEASGNTEVCNINNPQAGRYYVLLKGQAAYNGANLLATVPVANVGYENTSRFDIPDNSTGGVSSPINVPLTSAAGTVTVDVNIIHPYIGDLVVSLVAPDGSVYNLHNRSGGSADNIVKTFKVSAGSKGALGSWKLKVVDAARADVGYIQRWKISFVN